MKTKLVQIFLLLFIVACNQDSPNIKQISNMQYFIDNEIKKAFILLSQAFNTQLFKAEIKVLESPLLADTITAHFHGTLTDGSVFGALLKWVSH